LRLNLSKGERGTSRNEGESNGVRAAWCRGEGKAPEWGGGRKNGMFCFTIISAGEEGEGSFFLTYNKFSSRDPERGKKKSPSTREKRRRLQGKKRCAIPVHVGDLELVRFPKEEVAQHEEQKGKKKHYRAAGDESEKGDVLS